MDKNQEITIILPEQWANATVRVLAGKNTELVFIGNAESENTAIPEKSDKKHAFVYGQDCYINVALDEILWVKASGSYSIIHLSDGRELILSFNLSMIAKSLSPYGFVRIHRSSLVNPRHVKLLMGNSVKIGGRVLSIGREYREAFLENFIFLGTRKRAK